MSFADPLWRTETIAFFQQKDITVQLIGKSILCAATALVTGSSVGQAEFQVSGRTMPPPTSVMPVETRGQAPDALSPIATHGPEPDIARGFGHQVPLSFAVRQIVPKMITVSFAKDLDPDTVIVDWQGGRAWPDVLRTLLRQPRLLVTVKPGKVLITHAPA